MYTLNIYKAQVWPTVGQLPLGDIMKWNFPRAEVHAARIDAVLAALEAAHAVNTPLGFSVACAKAGIALGDSHATVARSVALFANLSERRAIETLSASRGQAAQGREDLEPHDLAAKVTSATPHTRNLTMAVTEVASDTRFSPTWVAMCERTHRTRAKVVKLADRRKLLAKAG